MNVESFEMEIKPVAAVAATATATGQARMDKGEEQVKGKQQKEKEVSGRPCESAKGQARHRNVRLGALMQGALVNRSRGRSPDGRWSFMFGEACSHAVPLQCASAPNLFGVEQVVCF